MALNIKIKTIPHRNQRYQTIGDWVFTKDGLTIYVSDVKNTRYELLVAVHELLEVILCQDRKISQKSVDAFDIAFEKNRKPGNTDEPGNSRKAPYYKEHQFATKVERMLAKQLRISWNKYEQHLSKY